MRVEARVYMLRALGMLYGLCLDVGVMSVRAGCAEFGRGRICGVRVE